MPNASQEEGTEITLDSEVVALGAGWTDTAATGSEVFRQGSLVVLALRVHNAAKAASLICTLPPEYRPASTVKDSTGKVEVLANGEVKALDGGVSLETAENRVYEVAYRAATLTP